MAEKKVVCVDADRCEVTDCGHREPHYSKGGCTEPCHRFGRPDGAEGTCEVAVGKKPSIGFVIGRFQVDNLHEGHIGLFDFALEESTQVVALIGRTSLLSVDGYALDFQSVTYMIQEMYPDVTCVPLDNCPDNAGWSAKVDSIVSMLTNPGVTAKLYGGRDSFIPHYEGRYECVEYCPPSDISGISATERREEIAADFVRTSEGRKGMILATKRSWVKYNAKMCIDVVAWKGGYRDHFLVGWKKDDPRLRLPGGFVDDGETLEMAVRRESAEEFNCQIERPEYIGSFVIDDWRYRPLGQHITTAAFQCHVSDLETPEAGDDLVGIKLVSVEWFLENEKEFIPGHARIIREACYANGSIRE